jgi:hypothetical protein
MLLVGTNSLLNASFNFSMVIVACSLNNHFPPFVIRLVVVVVSCFFSMASCSNSWWSVIPEEMISFSVAAMPQKTAIRPEQELLVT